jgi:HPt (histidine-containing phosphotransfer) domain-containing protein
MSDQNTANQGQEEDINKLIDSLLPEHRDRLSRVFQLVSSAPEDIRKGLFEDKEFSDILKYIMLRDLLKEDKDKDTLYKLILKQQLKPSSNSGLSKKDVRRIVRKTMLELGMNSPVAYVKQMAKQAKELQDALNELKNVAGLLTPEDVEERLEKIIRENLSEKAAEKFAEAAKEEINYKSRVAETVLRMVDRFIDRGLDWFSTWLSQNLFATTQQQGLNQQQAIIAPDEAERILEGYIGQGGSNSGVDIRQGNIQAPAQDSNEVAPAPVQRPAGNSVQALTNGAGVGGPAGPGAGNNGSATSGPVRVPAPPRVSLGGAGVPLARMGRRISVKPADAGEGQGPAPNPSEVHPSGGSSSPG